MTSSGSKFMLLLWKNWIIQSRHIVQTLFEIILPILWALLLLLIRGLVDPTIYDHPFYYTGLKVNTLQPLINYDPNPPLDWAFVYSPKNPVIEDLLETSLTYLESDIKLRIEGRENADDLHNYLRDSNILVGIEFDDTWANITELPDELSFSLRFPTELRTSSSYVEIYNWFTELMFPPFQVDGPRNSRANDGGSPPGYYKEGFVPIQGAISRAFIQKHNPNDEMIPEFFFQRFPYPSFVSDPLLVGLEGFVPLILIVAFIYTAMNIVKYVTVEKEQQLKEAMKIMGLPNWLHWTAWFTKCLIFFIIMISIITIIVKIKFKSESNLAVFTRSDGFAIWVYLLVYSITTICFCFLMSAIFAKATTASMVSGLIWFVTYLPFGLVTTSYDTLTLGAKYGISIFSNSAMSFGFQLIMRHEGAGRGLQWDNFFKPVSSDDDFTVGDTLIMLIVDGIIYMLLALYIEQINPGDFGVPEKWYFPFTKSFWCKEPKLSTFEYGYQENGDYSPNIESDPVGKGAGVQIRGLRKVYSNKKVAVSGLTLNMFEDEITVVLGHNGAGKTTTMSMLTGMFPPTSGTALINGKDIRTNINGVRESLGLCPQHNVLFDELTVREHIIFFSKLKGLSGKAVNAEVNKYVDLLELRPKINAQSKTLSGGMKRKLSIGVALCGGSKVVLCDEPTSGMDPSARRSLWDLLIKEKQGRTLLLTTHFMDEADVLGDRIAIMAEGHLKCAGSPFFLKKRYGVGYRLICVKNHNCDPQKTTEFLRKYIPDIQVETDIGTELSYILNEIYSSRFKEILSDFEENSEVLGISSYGVSLTTMEEVFLKVGSDSGKDSESPDSKSEILHLGNGNGLSTYNSREMLENGDGKDVRLLTGMKLVWNQVIAMFIKKMSYTRRNWITLLIQFLIPMIFCAMAIIIAYGFVADTDPPALAIDFENYESTITVLQRDSSFTPDDFEYKVETIYRNFFSNFPEQQQLVEITNNIQDYIMNLSEEKLDEVRRYYLIGSSITRQNMTAWFNNQGLHTLPLTVNLMYNAILNVYCPNCEIKVTNSPLPVNSDSQFQNLQQGNNMGFQLAFNAGFSFAFVASFYCFFYIKERISRSKLLQMVSGVNLFTYWSVSFIWDYLIFIVNILLYAAVLSMFQVDGWSTGEEIGRVILVMACFAFSILPLVYLFSFMFSVPSTGFTRTSIFFIIAGDMLFMLTFILGTDLFPDLNDVANMLNWIFFVFPHFSMIQSFSNMNIRGSTQRICKDRCDIIPGCTPEMICGLIPACCDTGSVFDWEYPGIGRNLIFLVVMGLIFILILMLIEFNFFGVLCNLRDRFRKYQTIPETEDDEIDSDVLAEKHRVRNMTLAEISSENLVLRDMTKFYKKLLAVNQLCVGVNHSECFGLLGVNGAGKTSTFKMLTGDENISSGEAWVQGISLRTDKQQVNRIIGYCPQFDALLEDLTGRETLAIYCLLRGVPNDQVAAVSARLAADLNFTKHLDKKIKEYSGGNKRKLSTAVALIGNPVVVYLDEPTTGMDPGAKRQLWNMVCKVREQGRSIILTSHSMEECEALCTRLAIMVNGEFKCLGSTQHLKNKFSKGFVLTIKLSRTAEGTQESNLNIIKDFITSHFRDANLKEEHSDMMTYMIPQTDLKWSEMFGIMEDAKQSLNIEDYSLGQTSLEQVFLFFTKYQRAIDDVKK